MALNQNQWNTFCNSLSSYTATHTWYAQDQATIATFTGWINSALGINASLSAAYCIWGLYQRWASPSFIGTDFNFFTQTILPSFTSNPTNFINTYK